MKSLAADMEPESSEDYIGGETGRLLHSAVYNVIVLSSEFANRLQGHTVSCVFSVLMGKRRKKKKTEIL
jgi:hypothetical protein